MGREIRMVPRGWKHPKDRDGKYIPLLKQSFSQADAKCDSALECDSYTEWNGRRPSPDEYMPVFPEGTATMLMMYEDTSEGTPISPAFETPEELAHWLADTGASAFGGMTATYEQWLATCKAGRSAGMVMQGGKMMSGV